MCKYGIPDQYIFICILYVFTYIDTYEFVPYKQLCTHFARIIRTYMYNREYVSTISMHVCTGREFHIWFGIPYVYMYVRTD